MSSAHQINHLRGREVAGTHIKANSDEAKLRRAAIGFETIILKEILKASHTKMSKSMFGGGMGEDFFSDFLDDERAKAMVESGGFGLSKMLMEELSPLLHQKKLKGGENSADKLNYNTQAIRAKKTYQR